jgi:inner membrane protein
MTARTHDIIAFATLVTVATYFQPQNLNLMTMFSAVIAADIGALLPDMDQAGNKLWDFLPVGNFLGKIFRRIFYKHRTITHSLLGLFLIYKFFGWLLPKIFNSGFINSQIVLLSLMVGVISHLLADSMTKDGIPLLFPLKLEIGFPPISKLRISTGGFVEKFLVFPGVLVYLLWFISVNQQALHVLFASIK